MLGFCTNFLRQSNGKVEAAVKSMKKLLQHSWNGRALDDEQFVDHCYNTAKHPVERMACHPLKNFLATQCKISYQHTGNPSCHNGNYHLKRLYSRLKTLSNYLQHTTSSMPIPGQTSMLVHMLWSKTLSPDSGTL